MKDLFVKTLEKLKNNKVLLLPLITYYLTGPIIIGLRKSMIPLGNPSQVDRLVSFIVILPLLMMVKTLCLAAWNYLREGIEGLESSYLRQLFHLVIQNIIMFVAFLPMVILAWFQFKTGNIQISMVIICFCTIISLPVLIYRLRTNRDSDMITGLKKSFSFAVKHYKFSLLIILLSILLQGSFWIISQISILRINGLIKMLLLVLPRALGLTYIITLAYEYTETHLSD